MTYAASPTETQAWQALKAHYEEIKGAHLRQLFAEDPTRAESFVAEGAGLFLDYSKNRLTAETIELLLQLARERGVEAHRDAMFRGDKINLTEKRAVLHMALRAPKGVSIQVDGQDVVPEVHVVLDKMTEFANRVRSGSWLGHTGRHIKNVTYTASGARRRRRRPQQITAMHSSAPLVAILSPGDHPPKVSIWSSSAWGTMATPPRSFQAWVQ